MDLTQGILIFLLVWNFLACMFYRQKFKISKDLIKAQRDLLEAKENYIIALKRNMEAKNNYISILEERYNFTEIDINKINKN